MYIYVRHNPNIQDNAAISPKDAEFYTDMDFQNIVPEEAQLILQLLCEQRVSFSEVLNLSHCKFLTDRILEEILKNSPKLQELNLSSCTSLTDSAPEIIAKYCKQLKTLILEFLPQLKTCENSILFISYRLNFSALTNISLKNCSHLRVININAPQLKHLDITGCRSLREFKLQTNWRDVEVVGIKDATPEVFEQYLQCTKKDALHDTVMFNSIGNLSSKVTKSIFNIVLLGGACVGKSAFLERWVKNVFTGIDSLTIGASFRTKTVSYNELNIKLEMWDTAGVERYRSLDLLYYRNVDLVLLFIEVDRYGVNKRELSWVNYIKSMKKLHAPRSFHAVVFTKIDLLDSISSEDFLANVLSIAEKYKFNEVFDRIFLSSSKSNFGFQEIEKWICAQLVTKAQEDVSASSSSLTQVTDVALQANSFFGGRKSDKDPDSQKAEDKKEGCQPWGFRR